jgi:Ca-activated chloride channel family protein
MHAVRRCLAAGVLLAAPVAALEVRFKSPAPDRPVFGPTRVEVEVVGEEEEVVRQVELRLDGRVVATVDRPPYRVDVDAGPENRERRFEAIARTRAGEIASAVLVTPAVAVDLAVEVALKQLHVTVARGGEPVFGLDRGSFTIYDDGSVEEIVTFAGGELPLTAVVMLDASASMRGAPLRAALAGAAAFAASMAPLDEAMLLLFADRLLSFVPLEGRTDGALGELAEIEAEGGTAVNDALYFGLRQLEARNGRRVVILLTDGVDGESVLGMEQLLWTLGRGDCVLYWIRLRGGSRDDVFRVSYVSALRDRDAHAAEMALLESAVSASGGRVIDHQGAGGLAAAFEEVLRELRRQYVLGYYPTARRRDGSWRPVRVEVAPGSFQVRTRSGYLDD